VLVRTHGYGSRADKSWLLIKHRDKHASKKDIENEEPRSILTGRLLAGIARDGGGDVEKASTGDLRSASRTAAPSASHTPKRKKKARA
jgi:hypothetical protein